MRIGFRRFRLRAVVTMVLVVTGIGIVCVGCGGKGTADQTSTTAAASGDTSTSGATATASRPPTTVPLSPGGRSAGSTTVATGSIGTSITTTTGVTATTQGATTATTRSTTTTARPTTTAARGEVVLRVTGSGSNRDFSMAELRAMPYIEGWGGWKNQLGNITPPTFWRGVPVTALMEPAGGGGSIVVVASDGYEQPFSAGDLGGDIVMYDPVTGDTVSTISGNLRAIIAYSENGAAIGSGQGPLRIAFVSPAQDQVTDGGKWVKWVVELRVN